MLVNKNGYREYFSYPLETLYSQLKKDETKIKAYEIANIELKSKGQELIGYGGLAQDVERLQQAIAILEREGKDA
jgi:hypothetical protein